jgi:hypothetical protein
MNKLSNAPVTLSFVLANLSRRCAYFGIDSAAQIVPNTYVGINKFGQVTMVSSPTGYGALMVASQKDNLRVVRVTNG